jgi:tRNA nucleotidyltransferase (CCA-adding enzyme)
MNKKCGIIYYHEYDQTYLLVQGKKSFKWGFPKGHMELGESEEQTAIREFFEETGILIKESLLDKKIRFKNNIYFRVNCTKKPQINVQDTNEIFKVSWMSLNDIYSLPKDKLNFGLKSWMNKEFKYLPKFKYLNHIMVS